MAFLSWVVSWSLRNRPIVFLVTAVFLLFGVRAVGELSIDAVPDITNIQVQIITSAPALSPTEVEQYVTIPVERAMAGVPRTTEVRSVSKYGLSLVTVVFEDDTPIYLARQLVAERMRKANEAIPPQYGKPEMGPISTGLGEVYQFSVQNPALTPMQLEELLTWQIAPQLRTAPGVVEVNVFGGESRQYQVVLDPTRLQAAGVSVHEVATALERSNANIGGGYIEHNREHFVIGTDGLIKNLEDLKRVVIGATPQGVPITVATVGQVRFGPRLRRGAASSDGKGEVVVGVALMLMGENSLKVTQNIKEKLKLIQPSLPKGTTIKPFYDRSILVGRTIRTVGKNLAEGAALVMAVLFLVLGSLRAGFVVALVIPLALLFAMIVMNTFGMSGNLMSLGALDFGLLVDGAVIIVENAARRLSERKRELARELTDDERRHVVEEATLEVRSASIFGELIIAIVYLPILALTGIEGKLFHPMATTVLLALGGAFILSLTLVPALTSYLVRPDEGDEETWLLRKIHAFYMPCLGHAFKHRALTVGLGVAGLALATGLFFGLGAEFIPQLDEGDILIEARRLPGTALSESVATDKRVQKTLLTIPEVEHVVSKTGAPDLATDPMGVEQTDFYMQMKERGAWRDGLTKEKLAKLISKKLQNDVPEVGGAISQPIQMRTNELVAGIRSDVALLIYGGDIDKLKALGERAASVIRQIPGAVDVRVEQVAGLKYLRIVPDRAKLARYGLSIDDVNVITQTLAVGYKTGEVLEGDRRFDIAIKTDYRYGGDIETLRALPLKSVSGQIVPLGDVVDLKFISGPAQVSRESQSRRLTVEFNVRGRDVISVVNDAEREVTRVLDVPTGYRTQWGGQFEHYMDAKARLLVVVPLTLLLISFLLWLAFHSVRSALLIFLNVPFAIIGGVVALWLRDIPFSISAGVGFIALFGVAVLNGLVLVSFARRLEESGIDHVDAIRQAAELRLRPVLTTALVASLGFIPMALSTSVGAEVQRPLATVVIGGLMSATLLTMFVLPVVYARFGKERAL